MIRAAITGVFMGIGLGSVFAVGVIAGWALDDDLPRRVDKIVTENDPVKPGEQLHLTFYGEALRKCPARVEETITDGKNFMREVKPREGKLNTVVGPFKDGNGNLGAPFFINTPKEAACGPASYDSDVYYTCNPWQYIFPLKVHRHQDFHFCSK